MNPLAGISRISLPLAYTRLSSDGARKQAVFYATYAELSEADAPGDTLRRWL
jgi:hypothetical protein